MRLLLYISFFLVGFSIIQAQTEYPKLTEFVTDKAQVMSTSELEELQRKLKSYETDKTHQIVVLTIESLEGEAIESYALEVFNINGIGQEKEDNGILILFSKSDREVRIEVGDGFQPIITDAFASRVIRNTMIPEFKEEDYFTGIYKGVDEIIRLIDDPKYRDEFQELIDEDGQLPVWGKILLGLFLTGFLGLFVFVGGRMFIATYKTLIDIYKGFIIGKISLLSLLFLLIGSSLGLLFSLPFIIMPLVFGYVFFRILMLESETIPFSGFETLINQPNSLAYSISFAVALLVVIPLAGAFLSKKPYQALKLSLLKNDKKYMHKTFSSSGYSWSSGSSFSGSSSSSSSFSGGGGSSSGGGASGSW